MSNGNTRWGSVGEILSFGPNRIKVSLSSWDDNERYIAISWGLSLNANDFRLNRLTYTWNQGGNDISLGPASSVSIDQTGVKISPQRMDRISIFEFDTIALMDWVQMGEIIISNVSDGTTDTVEEWNMRMTPNGEQIVIGIPSYGTTDGLDVGQSFVFVHDSVTT
jgi:hypothetical protein